MLRLVRRAIVAMLPATLRPPIRYLWRRYFLHNMEEELVLLDKLAKRRERAIDVGANVGLWTYKLSRLFKQVDAFEPLPWCAREIQSSLPHRNVSVHNVALSSEAGNLTIHIPVVGGERLNYLATLEKNGESDESLSVPVRTLDSYDFANVSFIKIDVEGHELKVIQGARRTIKRDKPVIVMEIDQKHSDTPVALTYDEMANLGYDAFFLLGQTLHPYSEFSYDIHQKPYDHLGKSLGYVDNFLFLPR